MALMDTTYGKTWAEKAKSLPPTTAGKHKNVNVDLKWPDDGTGKVAANHSKLTSKIGVNYIHEERSLLQPD